MGAEGGLVNPGFGPLLRKLRQQKEVSLNRLSKAIGVSGPYLSDVENGKRGPLSAERIEQVGKALKIDPMPLYVQAGHDRNKFKIPARVSEQHDRVASVLINKWEGLDEEALDAILKILKAA